VRTQPHLGFMLLHLILGLSASSFLGTGDTAWLCSFLRELVPPSGPQFARLPEGVPRSPVSSQPCVLRRGETPKVPLRYLITISKSSFPRECFALKEADLAFFVGFVGVNTDVQYFCHSLPSGPCGSKAGATLPGALCRPRAVFTLGRGLGLPVDPCPSTPASGQGHGVLDTPSS